MQWLANLLTWRSKRSAIVQWLAALLLFLAAFLGRWSLGQLHGAFPALTFYPAMLISAFLFGWQQAIMVLGLSVLAGVYFFLPSHLYLQPVGWIVVGGLNIAVIAALQHLAQELLEANERQRVLFQELQHRVANTLHAVVGVFHRARSQIPSSPDEAIKTLDSASYRFSAAAKIHRRLHDPAIFEGGLRSVLVAAVSSIIDPQAVRLQFDVAPLPLTFDQMSTLTMLVIEGANNAQKHVFQNGLGTEFTVSLVAGHEPSGVLTISDDGTGQSDGVAGQSGLGMAIIADLAKLIGGRASVASSAGHTIRVVFPTAR